MNASIYKISLDIHKTISQTQLNIIKDDNKRRFVFTLYEDGKPYIISDNCTAVFRAVKPNGAIVFNNCEIVDNTIIYDLVNETSAVAGIVDCEVTLYGLEIVDGEPVSKQITSPRFTMHIEDNLYDDSQVEGEDEFTALETAIGQVLAALAATENLDVNVSKSGNTATVTVTHKDGTTRSVNIYDGADGKDGQDGITPDISATATVDSNVGTPSVDVTKSGTTENPSFAFAFSNLKGAKGDTGDTMQRTGFDLDNFVGVQEGEIYQCIRGYTATNARINGGEYSSFVAGYFYEYAGEDLYVLVDTQPQPIIDQTYNPSSANAQSGIAVAEATDKLKWRKIVDITLAEDASSSVYYIDKDYQNNDFILSRARIFINSPIDASATASRNGYLYIRNKEDTSYNNIYYGAINWVSTTLNILVRIDVFVDEVIPTYITFSSDNELRIGSTQQVKESFGNALGYQKQITNFAFSRNAGAWKAGTRIVIMGIDK